MTRDELHALVWSQPMRTLAQARGISDVALAKQCRKAGVPVPPRGWWARKEAGRHAPVQPLPRLPLGAREDLFPAIERPGSLGGSDGVELGSSGECERPRPPEFRDLAAVTREIEADIGTIRVPANLASPHPIVARLLKQDAERAANLPRRVYVSSWDGPKFATPIQERRLRILSCILTELERLGCKVSGSTHVGERFSIHLGGQWTRILLAVEGPQHYSFYRDRGRIRSPAKDQLRFDITTHDVENTPPKCTWRDDSRPLERQATDIVRGIFLRAEEDSRKWALENHAWRVQERARKAAEAKLAAEKAEADRIAREKAEAAARIQRLLDGADALERAARIRRYVAAVKAENATLDRVPCRDVATVLLSRISCPVRVPGTAC